MRSVSRDQEFWGRGDGAPVEKRAHPVGKVLWHDATVLDESSDGLRSANSSDHRPSE